MGSSVSFIHFHSCNKYVSAFFVPGTVLDTGYKGVNKRGQVDAFMKLLF